MNYSFIIPVYNVERYLRACVESIHSQSDIEIILIDDGSTDSSGAICDELAASDSRIVVRHKPNGGQSSARNMAIELARGDYLVFLDSDDLLNGDITQFPIDSDVALTSGYTIAGENADTTLTDRREVDFGFDKDFASCTPSDLLRKLLAHENSGALWIWAPWSIIVRADFIKSNKLYFERGIYSEDAKWTPSVILAASKVSIIPYKGYIYRRRAGSTTAGCKPKLFFDFLSVLEHWYTRSDSFDTALSEAVRRRYANEFVSHYLPHLMFYTSDDKSKAKSRIQSVRLLDYADDKRFKPFVWVMRKVNFTLGAWLLNVAYRVRHR